MPDSILDISIMTEILAASPCIRNCCLDENDICLGCFRSLAEITGWSEADNTRRSEILRFAALRQREHQIRWQKPDPAE